GNDGLAEPRNDDLAHEHLQLLNSRWSLEVGAHEEGMAALLLEPARQLPGGRRLARALQTGEQHDGRRLGRVGDPEGLTAEGVDQLLVDDLDDLLGGAQALR